MTNQDKLSRRDFVKLASTAATAALLASCGAPTGSTQPGAVTAGAPNAGATAALETTAAASSAGSVTGAIRFITNDVGWREDRYRNLLPDFKGEHPNITIEYTHVTGDMEGQSLPTWAAAGTMPDVFYHRTQKTAARARLGWIKSLSEFIDADPDGNALTEDFWPVQVPQLKYEGKWYVLPENISSIGLRFRPEVFEEVGIAYPEKPWTYEEFRDVCAKMTKQENGKTVRWGFDPGWMLTGSSFAYLWLPAGIVDTEQNKAIIDHPENVKALNMLQDMKFKEQIIPRTEDLPQGVDLFSNDQMAMNAAGVWEIVSTRDAMQDKHWDVVWLPSNPLKSNENLSINYGAGYAMGRDTKAPEAAWELIRYLSEPERQQVLIVEDMWALPGRKSVTEAWVNSVLSTGSKEPQHVRAWVDALETGRSVPITPATQELEEQYPNLIGPILTTGDQRAEDLLPQIQADLQKILDKYA